MQIEICVDEIWTRNSICLPFVAEAISYLGAQLETIHTIVFEEILSLFSQVHAGKNNAFEV